MHKIHSQPGYVDSQYLDSANELLRPIKRRSHELLHVREGQSVLDLGCGVGIDTVALSGLVGMSGYVVGVDADPEMVAEANQRARRLGLEDHVSHQQADASTLPFPDEHFDACRAERILMHLADPVSAITELARVLKPGGWLVLTEPDWGTLSIASELIGIERRFAKIYAEHFLRSGYAGRQLYQWMRQAGIHAPTVEITPLWQNDLHKLRYLSVLDQVETFALVGNLVSEEELQAWRADLQQAHDRGCFFASLNIVTVAGQKTLAG